MTLPGPCSMPEGNKSRWEEMNEIVCDIHYTCDMDADKTHEYITLREWFARRGKLRTGKTA